MHAKAVIGAAFGDEGKGLMTDYFASQNDDTIVVRYNGGCQAGHTVQTPQGTRHVFGHFGAGTLAGADTFLSKYFIINPKGWGLEKARLDKIRSCPPIMYDPRCLVTTPWDMQINQALERRRGNDRHGSCGWGINETVVRNEHRRMVIADVNREHLEYIRDKYVPLRLKELGLSPDSVEGITDLQFACFVDLIDAFKKDNVATLPGHLNARQIIFEGAQGLLLDENHKFFPHVTRSSTGLKNIVELSYDMELTSLEVVYVTRSYMTRHGNGPFPSEDPSLRFEDLTNMPNPWQGNLRFGLLDNALVSEAVRDDMGHAFDMVNVCFSAAMTCLDQFDNPDKYLCRYQSYGPTRNHVQNRQCRTLPISA